MSGTQTAQTIRVVGRVEPHIVHVLVYGGSTLNFIQTQAARKLGLQHSRSPTLRVIVGNGEELVSNQVCKGVPLEIQGHRFEVDLYTIALSGSNVVLGTPWLKTLGQKFSLRIVSSSSTPPQIPKIKHNNPNINLLLTRYAPLFDKPTHLPPPRFTDHNIPLVPNAAPINVRPYRYPHAQKLEIKLQVHKLLRNGWIQPSNSPFSSHVLLLKKKDGTWRMCVDYRALNVVTIKDRFPLPTVDELLDELGSARVFSKLDLTSGFNQIRLQPQDCLKAAFRTHDGHYEYKVMPFGLCNAPATFQATMNNIFRPLLRKIVIVFFDNILVFSANEEQHVEHLEHVFHLLPKHQLYLKAPKFFFSQSQIDNLGHVVARGTVAPDPYKVQAIVDWPSPKNLKALRWFLGLSGYYRKFIKGYASIALPLTALLKKDAFQWNSTAQTAFDHLKQAMIDAPVFTLPDFDSHFASTYVRELHAITSAVKRWRQYLLGHFFIIQTDHKSLKELLTRVIQSLEQQHYLSKLLGCHYEIQYKPGNTNVVVDALSRALDLTNSSLLHLTVPQFLFLDELLLDPLFLELRDQCLINPNSLPDYQVIDGLLLRHGRIWLSPTSHFKELLLREYHETLVRGHAGLSKTMKRLLENFYWDNMNKEAQTFIRQCVICQQTKYSSHKPNGLLQPLPLPNNVWEDISMDFVTGLPLSKGFTVIMVVVDRFSKGIHLGALATGFTAYKVAKLFVSMVCKLHGLPKSIVSDRDLVFISRFWSDLLKFSGTLLRMSSLYHPQTDGQTEVMNRSVEQYLCAFVHEKPSQWYYLLPWAEYHYNTSIHTASGLSPFQVMFCKPAPSIPAYITGSSSIDACDAVLTSRDEILVLLPKIDLVAYKLALPLHSKIHNVVHNLEDKVGFVGGDIDMTQPKTQGPTKTKTNDEVEMPRAKRESKPPKRLEDYVTYLEASGIISQIWRRIEKG
ncbi:hypothetical protein L195_g000976 [Trifolium pratense]|uniref:RNA-directed DNA polymerase n=1 Tax=Trifolium pratense TaxID=57577 RepID=A0A2K3NND6_TRIPR|nr:hypothetical protein L195_g000976 [Trifolium pratense]